MYEPPNKDQALRSASALGFVLHRLTANCSFKKNILYNRDISLTVLCKFILICINEYCVNSIVVVSTIHNSYLI